MVSPLLKTGFSEYVTSIYLFFHKWLTTYDIQHLICSKPAVRDKYKSDKIKMK